MCVPEEQSEKLPGGRLKKAIVLTSGGLDSATCIALAKSQGYALYALSFDYGQKNKAELQAAEKIAAVNAAVSHEIIDIRSLGRIASSALIDSKIDVPDYTGKIEVPVTYVPARNTIFLSIALAYAEVREAAAIFIGCNNADYTGYPDCRAEYLEAFQAMANLALKPVREGRGIVIHAPLVNLSKREIIELGTGLNVDYSFTVSCYRCDEKGRACGNCDACTYRREGFAKAEIVDPTRYIFLKH